MIGSIPEVVQNGESGVLVKPDDPALANALLGLLKDASLQSSISSNFQQRGTQELLRSFIVSVPEQPMKAYLSACAYPVHSAPYSIL